MPSLAGSNLVGDVLGVNEGAWSGGAISFTLRWQRCTEAGDGCLDIADSIKPTYTIAASDVGSTLRAVVTASDEFGVSSAETAPSAIVQAAATAAGGQDPPPSSATPPSITGTTNVGETLTADDGHWPGITQLERQWQRCDASGTSCRDIGGESHRTYRLTSDDLGGTIRLEISVRAASGRATEYSDVTDVIAPDPDPTSSTSGSPGEQHTAPHNVTPPSTGSTTPVARTALVASHGTWQTQDDWLRFVYRWERCETAGGNCTPAGPGRTYTPTDADAGSTLQVIVTATDEHGLATSATSAPTQRVAPYSASGYWSWQLGPYAAKVDAGWDAVAGANAQLPAVAVVDSGVDSTLPGLAGSVVQDITLTSLPQGATADGYGHGSFVAQVIGGHAEGDAGAAPGAPLVSLDVMNDQGMALTSDVVAAADWIYAHKGEDNIRVANFSLIGSTPSSIMFDPLDRALERLWLSGVVVVTAAGNFAVDGAKSDVPFSPANDPFAITVGAADTSDTLTTADDFAAPWSAYGHSLDGFAKPELGAPGRYVVASVPTDSTLYTERADRIVGEGKLSLSGTSFAAPLVSGVAADLLAVHPDWTPDQVKGALMLSATQPAASGNFSLGVGEVDAAAALAVTDPPNPNAALEQFVVADPAGGATPVLDTASWGTAAQANASWGTASWGTASWGTASWGTASWGTEYWSSASWGTASWGTASWGTASWGTASWGTASWGTDNAKADIWPAGSYWMRWG